MSKGAIRRNTETRDKISAKSQQIQHGNIADIQKKERAKKSISKSYNSGKSIAQKDTSGNYLFSMRLAPEINQSTHWFQMIVIAFFTSTIIIITRMAVYERPMNQFFWSGGQTKLTDFFSYYKMEAILVCAALAFIILLYRIFVQAFFIKRSFVYIPLIVYSISVLLSYVFSDYKEFALLGWNERFEGTLVLLSYMIMLFFIVNSVNSERDVKYVVYPLAVTSAILGLLGLSQALDHDFFRTAIGKKLITPSWFWDQVDSLNFTFQNKEIYQTVYNINYVSFYLTLLIPLFGLLFIRSMMEGKKELTWKKIVWGTLFILLVFNLIGSASSGGFMGMAVAVFVAIIVLNKRIVEWHKPVLIMLALTVIVAGISYERWFPELSGAISSVLGRKIEQPISLDATKDGDDNNAENIRHKVDYIETTGDAIVVSFEGNEVTLITFPDDPISLKVLDAEGESISLEPTNVSPIYRIKDERFKQITVRPAQDVEKNNYIILGTDGNEWPFQLTEHGPKYQTGLGVLMDLRRVPAVGWANNQEFGSGRGYVWSRSIPMMKETLLLGHGADTFCIFFPHDDYVGKYNSGTFSNNVNIVVDKPHNMYFGMIIGTGGISMLALLVLWGIYIIQSFLIYGKETFSSFIAFTGAGIFFGICGFLASGLVNDSSVSVMPMFYGLLGTGIAINLILKKKMSTN